MTISRGNTITEGSAMFCRGESRESVKGIATDLLTYINQANSLCRQNCSDTVRCGSFVVLTNTVAAKNTSN